MRLDILSMAIDLGVSLSTHFIHFLSWLLSDTVGFINFESSLMAVSNILPLLVPTIILLYPRHTLYTLYSGKCTAN